MKIVTIAQVPDHLGKDWLQHLRDFDTAHPGCHFQVMADAPDSATEAIRDMVQIDPPLPHITVHDRTAFLKEAFWLSHRQCAHCQALLIAGPRGGAGQNFFCSNRDNCRHGFNLVFWDGHLVLSQDIGTVDDATYALYATRVS